MTTNEDIRTAQSKVREAYATEPDSALSTSYASAEIVHDLKCVFKQGTETAVMDLPELMGGTNKGPNTRVSCPCSCRRMCSHRYQDGSC